MDEKPRLSQRLVYLHCRSLFVGDITRMRGRNSIRNFLEQHRNEIPVLFDDYDLDRVCSIVQKLLADRIFKSEARARKRFPQLFDPARLPPSEKALSEKALSERILSEKALSEKASSEKAASDKALSEKASSEKASSETTGSPINTGSSWEVEAGAQNRLESLDSGAKPAGEAVTSYPTEQHTGESNIAEFTRIYSPSTAHSSEARAQVPPLAPVYLPFATQYWILNRVQVNLEGCCFDFAKKFLPELISSQELEVPEQLELSRWVSLLMQSDSRLPETVSATGWVEILDAAEKLQSIVTRRMRMTVNGMIGLLDDAIVMTQSFKDVRRTTWCQKVYKKLQSCVVNIEGAGKDLRDILSVQLQDIASKRAELDSIETKAIDHTMEIEKKKRADVYYALKQELLDVRIPGTKKSRLKGNLVRSGISGASADDKSSEKTFLYDSGVQWGTESHRTAGFRNYVYTPRVTPKVH